MLPDFDRFQTSAGPRSLTPLPDGAHPGYPLMLKATAGGREIRRAA